MLKKIADKHSREITCFDQDRVLCSFKLDNTTYVGTRKLHSDQIAVTSPDSLISAGSVLTTERTGTVFIVSHVTFDYYRGRIIRKVIDLLETNNLITVVRKTPVLTAQGGVRPAADSIIFENIPVKIWSKQQSVDVKLDTVREQFSLLLSSLYPVRKEDGLIFDTFYKDAKVEGLLHNHLGLQELTFDKDPR